MPVLPASKAVARAQSSEFVGSLSGNTSLSRLLRVLSTTGAPGQGPRPITRSVTVNLDSGAALARASVGIDTDVFKRFPVTVAAARTGELATLGIYLDWVYIEQGASEPACGLLLKARMETAPTSGGVLILLYSDRFAVRNPAGPDFEISGFRLQRGTATRPETLEFNTSVPDPFAGYLHRIKFLLGSNMPLDMERVSATRFRVHADPNSEGSVPPRIGIVDTLNPNLRYGRFGQVIGFVTCPPGTLHFVSAPAIARSGTLAIRADAERTVTATARASAGRLEVAHYDGFSGIAARAAARGAVRTTLRTALPAARGRAATGEFTLTGSAFGIPASARARARTGELETKGNFRDLLNYSPGDRDPACGLLAYDRLTSPSQVGSTGIVQYPSEITVSNPAGADFTASMFRFVPAARTGSGHARLYFETDTPDPILDRYKFTFQAYSQRFSIQRESARSFYIEIDYGFSHVDDLIVRYFGNTATDSSADYNRTIAFIDSANPNVRYNRPSSDPFALVTGFVDCGGDLLRIAIATATGRASVPSPEVEWRTSITSMAAASAARLLVTTGVDASARLGARAKARADIGATLYHGLIARATGAGRLVPKLEKEVDLPAAQASAAAGDPAIEIVTFAGITASASATAQVATDLTKTTALPAASGTARAAIARSVAARADLSTARATATATVKTMTGAMATLVAARAPARAGSLALAYTNFGAHLPSAPAQARAGTVTILGKGLSARAQARSSAIVFHGRNMWDTRVRANLDHGILLVTDIRYGFNSLSSEFGYFPTSTFSDATTILSPFGTASRFEKIDASQLTTAGWSGLQDRAIWVAVFDAAGTPRAVGRLRDSPGPRNFSIERIVGSFAAVLPEITGTTRRLVIVDGRNALVRPEDFLVHISSGPVVAPIASRASARAAYAYAGAVLDATLPGADATARASIDSRIDVFRSLPTAQGAASASVTGRVGPPAKSIWDNSITPSVANGLLFRDRDAYARGGVNGPWNLYQRYGPRDPISGNDSDNLRVLIPGESRAVYLGVMWIFGDLSGNNSIDLTLTQRGYVQRQWNITLADATTIGHFRLVFNAGTDTVVTPFPTRRLDDLAGAVQGQSYPWTDGSFGAGAGVEAFVRAHSQVQGFETFRFAIIDSRLVDPDDLTV